jgi:hypothetical protein
VLGTFFIIGAGPQAWLNRKVLANPRLVYIGLISYPLYLWHWPLLVIGRTIMRGYDNEHMRTTTIVAVILAFVLSWLTYQFIERPVRARRLAFATRRITAALFAGMASVALLGFAIVQGNGLPSRYPEEVQALLTPLTLGEDYPPTEESKNSTGPLLVTYGDSHAWHLGAGLRRLQNERTFRLVEVSWGNCNYVKSGDEKRCSDVMTANEKLLEQLKPDIVVIAAFWIRYNHFERINETLRFLQRIGVRRIVVIGTVPFWPKPPQLMLYNAYRRDPLHRIPERLFGFDKETLEADRQIREITSSLGVPYISAYDTLCNENGCLVRLGNTARDIVQVDLTHFSAAGSWFFVSHIANQIFD